ncbi:MAG: hypothetical protein ACSLEL_02650 [Candidatus Malihini olakiniferum]
MAIKEWMLADCLQNFVHTSVAWLEKCQEVTKESTSVLARLCEMGILVSLFIDLKQA